MAGFNQLRWVWVKETSSEFCSCQDFVNFLPGELSEVVQKTGREFPVPLLSQV